MIKRQLYMPDYCNEFALWKIATACSSRLYSITVVTAIVSLFLRSGHQEMLVLTDSNARPFLGYKASRRLVLGHSTSSCSCGRLDGASCDGALRVYS
jgi:hypothetical protein